MKAGLIKTGKTSGTEVTTPFITQGFSSALLWKDQLSLFTQGFSHNPKTCSPVPKSFF